MEPTSTASTRTVRWLLAGLFAVTVFRAATQSITTDEAFTYLDFVAPGLTKMALRYDANNHVLYTVLASLSVQVLGLSELALRLPSLAGAGLYLTAVWRLCRRVFEPGPMFLTAVGLLSLNPLVLDYLSAARGYGLALALWMWALVWMLESVEGAGPPALYGCGVLLALAVTANLTLLFPGLGLAAVFAAMLLVNKSATLWNAVDRMALPALAVLFVVLLLPLQQAGKDNFYYGAAGLAASLDSIAVLSLFHGDPERRVLGMALDRQLAWDAGTACVRGIVGAVLAGALWGVVRTWRRPGRGSADAALLLAGGCALLTLAELVAAHRLAGVLYPMNRTGLYWIPLLSLVGLSLVRKIGRRWATAAGLAAAGLICGQYLSAFSAGRYAEWPEQAGVKRLAQALAAREGNRPLRVAAGFALSQPMEFYRRRLGMTKWERVERLGEDRSLDYYLLQPPDDRLIGAWGLRVVDRAGPLLLAGRR